jgi:hypothetical protein
MTNFDSVEKALEDNWFGIARNSSLRHNAASSSDLQNNPHHVTETLRASPSAPNLRQRSNLKPSGHRRKATAGDLKATEKPPRGHVRRASTSSIDLSHQGGPINAPNTAQDPVNGSVAQEPQPLPLPGHGRPPRPDAPSRASARLLKSQNAKDYAEHRKAWRARLEATISAPRLYTATVAIPSKSRAPSVQSTPSGSPKPPQSPISQDDQSTQQQQQPSVPAVWVGHSSDHAPQNFSTLDDDALRRFIQQAGYSPPLPQTVAGEAVTPLSIAAMSHNELVTTAQGAKSAWEVERIVVGCSLPEQILRVQKSDCTDPLLLKAAWKKLAFQVHPDRCSADGASIAMAIAKDAFDILAFRAEQYQAAAAFALSQNGNDAGRLAHTTTHLGATSTGAGAPSDVHGNNNSLNPASRPLSAPAEIVAGGSTTNDIQPPLKVRVKLKVKKVDTAAVTTEAASINNK